MNQNGPRPTRNYRLSGYDYSRAGIYFITIATSYHALTLGTICDGQMHLSEAGAVAHSIWTFLPDRFPGLELDVWIVMPNHLHGLILLPDQTDHLDPFTVSQVVRSFKARSTRLIRTGPSPSFAWQPNYYEHVVRTDHDLQRIREYIVNNPLQWSLDRANPDHLHHINRDYPYRMS